jgi:hypothetical protein
MSKLHEVLAVEADLEGKFKRSCDEAKKTFKDRPAHFIGSVRELTMFSDDGIDYPSEQQEMATTVHDKLAYIKKDISAYINALCQKESTNQKATAKIVIDGIELTGELPATFLLGMESRLKYIRSVYETIPTLPVNIHWEKDESAGDNIFVTKYPEEKLKTARTFKSKVLVPAQFPKDGERGDSLPAQIEKWEEVENVGKFVKTIWSGMLPSSEKSKILGRIDDLIRAVKQARQRANATEVQRCGGLGNLFMDYING